MIIKLPDINAMDALGARIAAAARAGDVIALSGGLGAGKTTLARSILAGLGHEGEVPSPTFTIIETYENLAIPVVHADFYRLHNAAEALQLGLPEHREGALLIAEWPENAGGFAHDPACLSLDIEIVGEGRKAIARCGADWHGRFP